MRFLLRLLLNGVAVFLTAQLVPGIGIASPEIFGWDINAHGTDGVLATSQNEGDGYKVSVETFDQTTAKVTQLPSRPSGGHVVSDLMAFYFRSSEANDVAHRARIGRQVCRPIELTTRRPTSTA